MPIHGKVALITGAGRGIGRAIALRLARDGAHVAIVDLEEATMKAVAEEVQAIGRKATTFRADVSDRDNVFAAVDHAEQELGGFDIMVNNAGIAQVQALLEVTPAEIDTIMRINVYGVLWGIQAAAKELASSGITVNAYCPGVVGTDMWVEIDRRFSEVTGAPLGATYQKYVEGIALGRAETPEDVASFVSYLAGPDSDYMTGQSPMIDGGIEYR